MILLRPWGVLLFLMPLIWWMVHRQAIHRNPWVGKIDAALMPYLWISGEGKYRRFAYGYLTLVWIVICVAVVGPAWQKKPVPLKTEQPGNVFILDLSPAMTPDKLKIAHMKIYDMLEQLRGEQVGIVLYDTDGYIAMPMTPDVGLVQELVSVLNPTVLPVRDFNPVAGFQKADSLLQQAGLSDGRIIFITAGSVNTDELERVVRAFPYRVGVLGIGSEQNGQPVALPQGGFLTDTAGKPVVIRLGSDVFRHVGVYQDVGAGDDDVRRLLSMTGGTSGKGEKTVSDVADVWEDGGIWFLIVGCALVAFLFRRGMIFVILFGSMALPGSAGFWERSDQEAYAQSVIGEQAYQNGQYDVAVTAFEKVGGADGFYNQGNALAHKGEIEAAIAMYQSALDLDPAHDDAAFNKAYLEQQQQQQPEKSESQDNQSDPDEETPEEENNQSGSNQSESSSSDPQQDKIGQNRETDLDETPQKLENEKTTDAPAQVPMNVETTDTQNDTVGSVQIVEDDVFDQESREVLNRLPNDPARILRYRIYQQYQQKRGK